LWPAGSAAIASLSCGAPTAVGTSEEVVVRTREPQGMSSPQYLLDAEVADADVLDQAVVLRLGHGLEGGLHRRDRVRIDLARVAKARCDMLQARHVHVCFVWWCSAPPPGPPSSHIWRSAVIRLLWVAGCVRGRRKRDTKDRPWPPAKCAIELTSIGQCTW
jgi:hypothetical protein